MRADLVSRHGFAVVAALAFHVLAIGALALAISFQLPQPEVVEPRVVAIATKPPPPPDVEVAGPANDVLLMSPRFRPREPLGVPPEVREKSGSPGLAVWTYLCNKNDTLSEAANKACPPETFGTADMSVRDPLNRQGDAGVMFGAETSTMTLQEAGIKRGWMKKPPAQGQSGLAETTDQPDIPGQAEFYKENPWTKPQGENIPNTR